MALGAIIRDLRIRAKAHSSQLLVSSRPSLAIEEAAAPIRPTNAARTSRNGRKSYNILYTTKMGHCRSLRFLSGAKCRTIAPENHRFTVSEDHMTGGAEDHRSRGPHDQRSTGPEGQGTRGLELPRSWERAAFTLI